MRVYERQCTYCQAMAVLHDYCRVCESPNPKQPESQHAPESDGHETGPEYDEARDFLGRIAPLPGPDGNGP